MNKPLLVTQEVLADLRTYDPGEEGGYDVYLYADGRVAAVDRGARVRYVAFGVVDTDMINDVEGLSAEALLLDFWQEYGRDVVSGHVVWLRPPGGVT